MPKIDIFVSLKNSEETIEYKTKAIFAEDSLKFLEKDGTRCIYYYHKNILIRENNKLRMEYIFDDTKETMGNINIKDLAQDITIKIKTKNIKEKNKNIEIEYEIENDNFIYRLEVIE